MRVCSPGSRISSLGALAMWLVLAGCGGDPAARQAPFPPLFANPDSFVTAIRQARPRPLTPKVTGLTVPHHLLAADLIAEALARLSRQDYQRIVILSPDHFSRAPTPFAVTFRDFRTALGPVTTDGPAVRVLLENRLVAVSDLFSHEHGVQALLPFLAHYFPRARLVPVAIRLHASPAEWDSLAATLTPLLTPRTLLVQSTDFSHYLPREAAQRQDQETLRVLSGGDPASILTLTEPDHLDCRAAQYLQLRLQRQVYGARPTVIAHGNSQDYTTEDLRRTTSYLVQLYSQEVLPISGAARYFFAGDTFSGRYLAKQLAREEWRESLVEQVLGLTGGAPLIVNLEGVIMAPGPEQVKPYQLCMAAGLTLPLLTRLQVRAVSLANNHSRDFGDPACRIMVQQLAAAGIGVLPRGSVTDLGAFRLAALTDVDNRGDPPTARLGEQDLHCLDGPGRDKPLFALIHWGREYHREPGPREEALAARLEAKGVELIIGSHSHRASGLASNRKACRVFSLGNFVFDQSRPGVSGALLEVVFFPRGTYFLRLHPWGNLPAR